MTIETLMLGDRAWRFTLPRAPTRMLLTALRALPSVCDVVLSEGHVALHFFSTQSRDEMALVDVWELLKTPFVEREGTVEHELLTTYDGPDLEEIGAATQLSVAQIASLHSGQTYEVKAVGFVPGFAYLGSVPQPLRVSRRKVPRVRVEANRVGIADTRTGVYPFAGPGGWNLIGTVHHQSLFGSTAGAMLSLGDRVRFVSEKSASAVISSPTNHAISTPLSRAAHLVIERCDAFALLQDRGRFGWMHQGVSQGGALWPTLAQQTLRALKLSTDAPVIELYGAILVRAEGQSVWLSHNGRLLRLRPGESARFERPPFGRVAYLAALPVIAIAPQLGSVSQLLRASLGGLEGARHRSLRAGDMLVLSPHPLELTAADGQECEESASAEQLGEFQPIRVTPGPDLHRFGPQAFELFVEHSWQVSAKSDRVGVRLEGTLIERSDTDHGISVPMVAGAVQVPADGGPIVLGVDHPPTGGYPVLAVVRAVDLPLLAARKPGAKVRFSDGL